MDDNYVPKSTLDTNESGEVQKFYRWRVGPFNNLVEKYVAQTPEYVFFQSGRNVSVEDFESNLSEISESEYNKNLKDDPLVQAESNKKKRSIESLLGNNDVPPPPKKSFTDEFLEKIFSKESNFKFETFEKSLQIKIPKERVIHSILSVLDDEEIDGKFIDKYISEFISSDIKEIFRELILNEIKKYD